MSTEPNSIYGFPKHLQCVNRSLSVPGGAIAPGEDILLGSCFVDYFVMSLSLFHANGEISGLLMYDRGEATQMRVGRPPVPDRPAHDWLFFGYECQRCYKTFLLPYWVRDKEDLPRAVHHFCHGGLDIDEVPRRQIRELANDVAVKILNKISIEAQHAVNRQSKDHLGYLITYQMENALGSFWQAMVTSAVEKAQGRG